jgi:hypothetical protein
MTQPINNMNINKMADILRNYNTKYQMNHC